MMTSILPCFKGSHSTNVHTTEFPWAVDNMLDGLVFPSFYRSLSADSDSQYRRFPPVSSQRPNKLCEVPNKFDGLVNDWNNLNMF